MSQLRTLLWAKGRMTRHTLASVRRESTLKVTFVSISTVFLLLGIFVLSRLGFRLFEIFGAELLGSGGLTLSDLIMSRLLSVFALTLFVLLVFSNVLVAFQTLYRAREVSYLVQSPLPTSTFFLARFYECVTFSSWASAFLGAPVMLAYGLETGAPPVFYLALVAFYVPFVTIPAALGTMITMVLARYLTHLKRGPWVGGGLLGVAVLFGVFRRRFQLPDLSSASDIQALIDTMGRTQNPFLPSQWAASGVLAAATGDVPTAIFQFLLLLSNALLLVWVATWVAERLFYTGWSAMLAGEETRGGGPRRSPLRFLDVLLRPLREPVRSLMIKDIRLFWRDPAQWAQFVLLFGILTVYAANMRQGTGAVGSEGTWRAFRVLLNMGASMLILASLTTRFIYPLISLEGPRFWILGLAPLSRRQIVWQKFWLSILSTSAFTVGLAVVSAWRLGLDPVAFGLSVGGVILATLTLSGLAVGLGAIYPNFEEDNPARVVSGMGGTLNFLLSMLYILLMLAGQALVLMWGRFAEHFSADTFPWVLAGVGVWMVALSAVVGYLPMQLGIRNLERTEI